MTLARVLFVGLGGAGQRHLRILRARLPDADFYAYRQTRATPVLNSDFTVDEAHSLEQRYDIQMTESLEAGLASNPDLVVISTPSALHFDPMMAAVRARAGILVEKPWSHTLGGFADFYSAVVASQVPFRVSFQRRHHQLLRRIKAMLADGLLGTVISAHFDVGSYVPSWHGYEDWRTLYAVRPELGGGVLLTEIHELDLAHWFFGIPERVSCVSGCFGRYALEVEDTAHVTLDYGSFSVQIALCFMTELPRRSLEVAGTKGFLRWNANDNKLVHVNHESKRTQDWTIPGFTNDDMFEAQADDLLASFDTLANEEHLAAAWTSQAIVTAAKVSSAEKRAVSLPVLFTEGVQ